MRWRCVAQKRLEVGYWGQSKQLVDVGVVRDIDVEPCEWTETRLEEMDEFVMRVANQDGAGGSFLRICDELSQSFFV